MHRTTFSILCSLSILGLLAASSRSASAKDDRKAQLEQERAAKKACAMGNYERGADILTDLLIATNDPTYIYNQARCYEQNSLWERAISRFREYLRKANELPERDRVDTEKHIAECQAALAQQAATVRPATPEAPVTNATLAPAGAAYPSGSEPIQSVGSPPASPAAPAPGRSLRVAGIVSGVMGLAALGAGVGFALKTQSISDNEQKNGPTQAQEDERKRYETWGWVSYGVGAGALVTGVVLYLVGRTRGQSTGVALLPSVGRAGAALLLGGRF